MELKKVIAEEEKGGEGANERGATMAEVEGKQIMNDER